MKTRIKQIISLAFTFLIFGGCVSVNKNLPQDVHTAQTESTSVENSVHTSKSTATETTENITTVYKETTKKFVSTSAKKVTAMENVATKPVVSSTKAETINHVTTTQKVTSDRTAVQTVSSTVAAVQNSEGIIIGIKNVRFGCDMQSVTDTFGNPCETVSESLSTGGAVKSLVYADDYAEFAVFQFLNGRLFAFYTVAENTIITDGRNSFSLRAGGDTEIGDVKITVYRDSKKGNEAYAFKASFSGFDYYPHELTSLDGQERLLFHTTNALRAINGLYALEYCEKASECVRKHCKDMSARSYFSHDTPEGITSSQRMKNSGIEFTSCGENLAAGYLDAFGIADGWYNSSGHRKNVLDTKFRYLGVCVVSGNESYNIYAGQNYYA